MSNTMVNAPLNLTKPLPSEEVLKIIQAQAKTNEKKSWLSFDFLSTPAKPAVAAKAVPEKVLTYNHTSGASNYKFSIPGVDPKNVIIKNKDRKITITEIGGRTIGVITTYDQIDITEVTAIYKFGELIVTITPNTEKFKEYEISVKM